MDEFLQAPPRLLIVAIENYDRHPKREGTTAAAPQELFAQTLVWMRDASHDDRALLYRTAMGCGRPTALI